MKEFARLANKMGRRPVPASTAPLELLRKLGLVRDRRPTRAAILLFGKDPQKYYGEAIVKAGRFRGETLIVDDREIEGTLFDQVEGVSGYFRERLETRFERTGAPRREVVWEYPLDALREAVVNAVCHRDYLSRAQTQVRIYDSELVVMNPGGLPGGLTVAALTEKHESLPRNRLIAKILYYAGLIERWGSGIAKMVEACSAAGLPAPVFAEGQGFSVSFKKPVVAGATRTPSFAGNSLHLPPNSLHLPPNSLHLPGSPMDLSAKLAAVLTPLGLSVMPRKVKSATMRKIVLGVCGGRYMSLKELASLLKRDPVALQNRYLTPMLGEGLLELKYPGIANHPNQAYRTKKAG